MDASRSYSIPVVRRLGAVALAVSSFGVLASGVSAQTTVRPAPRADLEPQRRDSRAAVDGRTAVSVPGTELANEVVTVSWTGFTPTNGTLNTVIVLQCTAAPTSLDDCDTSDAFPSVTDGNRAAAITAPDGTGSTQIEVRPAAFLPDLGCSAASPCSLLVYENDGLPFNSDELPSKRVVVPITFARSQADCPPVTDFDVRADGSASAAPLFYRWAGDLCQGDGAVVLDYTESSSTSGRENFLSGLTDLGLSALPATEEELDAHPDHRDYSYAPVAATAMVVAFNLRDPYSGERLDDIVLSPRLVTRLITNTDLDTFFKDRELLRLNPGVRFPSGGATRPLLRAERSASTSILTAWMAADDGAQQFLSGDDEFRVSVTSAYQGYQYPTDAFANVSGDSLYLPRQGQRAIALRLFYGVAPTGTAREDTSFNGVIGIVDLPTARRFGLQVARLVQPDDSVVSVTDESILAGVSDMDTSDAGTLIADPTPEDMGAYPLVRVEYALVPDELPTSAKRADVRAVLRHAIGDGQESLPEGYVTLPADLRAQTDAVIAALRVTKTPSPTTTTTTTTPTTSTTSTTTTTTTTVSSIAPITVPVTAAPTTPVATTVAPTTTTPTATSVPRSTTTTTSVATTVAPAITVPEPQLALPDTQPARPARIMGGLAGLSSAAMLGTVPPGRLRRFRPKWPRKST